jgi:hypothetical protein
MLQIINQSLIVLNGVVHDLNSESCCRTKSKSTRQQKLNVMATRLFGDAHWSLGTDSAVSRVLKQPTNTPPVKHTQRSGWSASWVVAPSPINRRLAGSIPWYAAPSRERMEAELDKQADLQGVYRPEATSEPH